MELTEIAKSIALALALAFMAESGVEYILGTPFDKFPKLAAFKWALMYVALAVGIALAFSYRLDLISLILGQPPSVQGILLSGVAIGRGANFVHDFITRYILPPKP